MSASQLGEASAVEMESGVSLFTGEPFVAVRTLGTLDNGRAVTLAGQLSPTELREHAMRMLEAAEAAVQDAALLRFLDDKLGLDKAAGGRIIADLREFRRGQ